MFQRQDLKFAFDAFEPFLDAVTMEIHTSKHHQGYVNKLNAALEDYPELLATPIEKLLQNPSDLPEEVRTAVINNGGGHANHTLFFNHLCPGPVEVPSALLAKIEQAFTSFDQFKEDFSAAAATLFGSGWVFLCQDQNGNLIMQTQTNQNSPLSEGLHPIMVIDVWEHAYYLHYQNRRPEYIENFFNIIDWNQVQENMI